MMAEKMERLNNLKIEKDLDYQKLTSLSFEAREKT